jgi:hypothetical protein
MAFPPFYQKMARNALLTRKSGKASPETGERPFLSEIIFTTVHREPPVSGFRRPEFPAGS